MHMHLLRIKIVAAALLLALVGCGGPKPVPVTGTLHWEDGKPVAGASVRFVPAAEGSREASGFTGKDGEFVLSTMSAGDGALPGSYTVVVTKSAAYQLDPSATAPNATNPADMGKMMAKAAKPKAKVEDPVPAAYSDAKTSPLKWTVDAATPKVELKLKRL